MSTNRSVAFSGRNRGRIIRWMPAAALACMALLGTGCGGRFVWGSANNYVTPVKPPQGWIFTTVSAPLETNFEGTSTRKEDGSALRTGTSHMSYLRIPFIYLDFTWGDGSLQESTDRANIKTLHYADYELLTVLGLYGQYEFIARGE